MIKLWFVYDNKQNERQKSCRPFASKRNILIYHKVNGKNQLPDKVLHQITHLLLKNFPKVAIRLEVIFLNKVPK